MKPINLSEMLEEEEYLTEIDVKDDNSLADVMLPVIRRVYPSMIANDLVSVSPMKMPSESAESICKMANGLVEKGIVNGEYDRSESKNGIYYMKPVYGNKGSDSDI